MSHGPVAAIDCGTNSTRLLIVGPDGETLDRRMRITRLGQGVDQTQRLAPEAIERTMAVLREYRQAMDDRAASAAVRMTATSAARDAANREEFFTAAEAVVGSGPELAVRRRGGPAVLRRCHGVARPRGRPVPGGRHRRGLDRVRRRARPRRRPLDPESAPLSVDVGCVRLTERFLHHDPPRPEELAQALSVVEDYLDDVRREIPDIDPASAAWSAWRGR